MSTAAVHAPPDRLYLVHSAEAEDPDPRVVGAKAANLMRMAAHGLPIPPGFTLSTRVCADYYAAGQRLDLEDRELIASGIRQIERATGCGFGSRRRPLLVSVRSGAPLSMPGMLDTLLNVGLSDETLPGLLRATGDPRFVWDSYRRFIQSYAEIVDGIAPAPFTAAIDEALRHRAVPETGELDAGDLRTLAGRFSALYTSATGRGFPQDPREQLQRAVDAVLRSWNTPRAVEYRRLENITGLPGTAVTVQAMVFGNLGPASGSGVGFTRDPATGRDRLYTDFVLAGQGEDVVAGRHAAADSDRLIGAVPGLAEKLHAVRHTLERVFRDAQDFEFTVQDGKLWLLQTRAAQRTPWAALRIACDLVDDGLIDEGTALERLLPYDVDAIRLLRLDPGARAEAVGQATPAGAGAATGRIAVDPGTAVTRAERGEPVVLVREEATTDDIAALALCRGLLTATGARTSHAAVVARQHGVVCLLDCPNLGIDPDAGTARIGEHVFGDEDEITIDGGSGRIYAGAVPVVEERPTDLVRRVHGWQRNAAAAPRPHTRGRERPFGGRDGRSQRDQHA